MKKAAAGLYEEVRVTPALGKNTVLVGYDFNELGQTVTALLGNEPEFGKMRSERIDQLGALADQESARAVNGKRCLLP